MSPNRAQNQRRAISFPLRRGSRGLVACSVCLRVRDGGTWIETEEAIRRLRTFERGDVIRLRGALCERCETELWLRRRNTHEELAA
jgi:hypothetical protein